MTVGCNLLSNITHHIKLLSLFIQATKRCYEQVDSGFTREYFQLIQFTLRLGDSWRLRRTTTHFNSIHQLKDQGTFRSWLHLNCNLFS